MSPGTTVTRIDFYLLDSPEDGARDLAACRLAQKAFALGHRVYVLTAAGDEAQRLDQLLWTFSASSFVPHELHLTEGHDPETPVLIGAGPPPPEFEDVLITLAAQVPECFSRFRRVAEVVSGADADKQQARDRFRYYRDRGYQLDTHRL